jgi:ankyrin repeat protein
MLRRHEHGNLRAEAPVVSIEETLVNIIQNDTLENLQSYLNVLQDPEIGVPFDVNKNGIVHSAFDTMNLAKIKLILSLPGVRVNQLSDRLNNQVQRRGRLPFHIFLEKYDLLSEAELEERLNYFLDEAKVDINAVGTEGLSPLMFIVHSMRNSHSEKLLTLFRYFLRRGAAVNVVDGEGMSLLFYAFRLLEKSSKESSLKGKEELHEEPANVQRGFSIITALIEAGAVIDLPNQRPHRPGYGPSVLFTAIELGNKKLVSLLLQAKADPNIVDVNNQRPLHIAVNLADIELCGMLLRSGATPDFLDRSGNAPLHRAILSCNIELCELLLEANADINIRDGSGNTPLHLAVEAIPLFALPGQALTMCELLLRYRPNVNLTSPVTTQTPFTSFIFDFLSSGVGNIRGQIKVFNNSPIVFNFIKQLIMAGADVNMPFGNVEDCALHLAITACDFALSELLLGNGANINAVGLGGNTPLHLLISLIASKTTEYQSLCAQEQVTLEQMRNCKSLYIRRMRGETSNIKKNNAKHNNSAAKKKRPASFEQAALEKATQAITEENQHQMAEFQLTLNSLRDSGRQLSEDLSRMQQFLRFMIQGPGVAPLQYDDFAEAALYVHAEDSVANDNNVLAPTRQNAKVIEWSEAFLQNSNPFGINLMAIDNAHRSPLFLAISAGLFEIAKLLLDNKVDAACVWDQAPMESNTALHLALTMERPDLVALLLQYGAKVCDYKKTIKLPLVVILERWVNDINRQDLDLTGYQALWNVIAEPARQRALLDCTELLFFHGAGIARELALPLRAMPLTLQNCSLFYAQPAQLRELYPRALHTREDFNNCLRDVDLPLKSLLECVTVALGNVQVLDIHGGILLPQNEITPYFQGLINLRKHITLHLPKSLASAIYESMRSQGAEVFHQFLREDTEYNEQIMRLKTSRPDIRAVRIVSKLRMPGSNQVRVNYQLVTDRVVTERVLAGPRSVIEAQLNTVSERLAISNEVELEAGKENPQLCELVTVLRVLHPYQNTPAENEADRQKELSAVAHAAYHEENQAEAEALARQQAKSRRLSKDSIQVECRLMAVELGHFMMFAAEPSSDEMLVIEPGNNLVAVAPAAAPEIAVEVPAEMVPVVERLAGLRIEPGRRPIQPLARDLVAVAEVDAAAANLQQGFNLRRDCFSSDWAWFGAVHLFCFIVWLYCIFMPMAMLSDDCCFNEAFHGTPPQRPYEIGVTGCRWLMSFNFLLLGGPLVVWGVAGILYLCRNRLTRGERQRVWDIEMQATSVEQPNLPRRFERHDAIAALGNAQARTRDRQQRAMQLEPGAVGENNFFRARAQALSNHATVAPTVNERAPLIYPPSRPTQRQLLRDPYHNRFQVAQEEQVEDFNADSSYQNN